MNIIVGVLHKRARGRPAISASLFSPYVPVEPSESREWRSADGSIQIISIVGREPWGHPALAMDDRMALAVDGVMPARPFTADHPIRPGPGDQGEFAAIWSDGSTLQAMSEVSGSRSLYIAETEDLVAVSNRSVCLLGLPGLPADVDPEGIRWKAFQGYVGSDGTAFSAIRKLRNGSLLTVAADGARTVDEASYATIVDPQVREAYRSHPLRHYHEAIDRLIEYLRAVWRLKGALPAELPLSGGRDSRVLLALLVQAGLLDGVERFYTKGAHYSPEVLAAQDLLGLFGVDRHDVFRPDPTSVSRVRASVIVQTIDLSEGMLSLYDFCLLGSWKRLRLQGHQSTFRGGRWSEIPTGSFDAFVAGARATWPNKLGVVRDLSPIDAHLGQFWEAQRQAGVPPDDLSDVFEVFQRHPNWLAVICNTDHFSGPIANPLVNGDLLRFMINVPRTDRHADVFHYLILRRADPRFLHAPFAYERWRSGLSQALATMGVRPIEEVEPYRSRPYFPDLRNPFVSNVKLDYLDALKPVVTDLLTKHTAEFDEVIDVGAFLRGLAEAHEPRFDYLYSAMGVYSAVLLREYGAALFDRRERRAVVEDLQERLDAARPDGDAPAAADLHWDDTLERHEVAIAELMREARTFDTGSESYFSD